MVTYDLADFGVRERCLVANLMNSWNNSCLPDDFYNKNIYLCFNQDSGEVFLTNENGDVAVDTGNKLESYYYTPYGGYEGTLEELIQDYKYDKNLWSEEDVEYLQSLIDNKKEVF